MRILMMGTGGFAVPTFRWLLKSDHEVAALITRPPRPVHGRRRQRTASNPMREVAEEQGLPVLMPESVNATSAIEQISAFEADLHVVCDYGQILSGSALASSRLGGINLHASLLPKHRGAAPINWALYQGEKETGVTVIHMTPRLDAGPCLLRQSTPIGENEDAVSLEARLAQMGAHAVEASILLLAEWDGAEPIGETQDTQKATKAPRLTKSDGCVDWGRTAQQIFDQVRAMKPWPGTFTHWKGRRRTLRIVLDQVRVADETDCNGARPGSLLPSESSRAIIACGQGALELLNVQPEGKKRMPAEDFLRGHPLPDGEYLE